MTRLPGAERLRREGPRIAIAVLSLATACTSLVTMSDASTGERPSASATRVTHPGADSGPVQPSPDGSAAFSVTMDASHAPWASEISRGIGTLDVSVSVGIGSRIVYAHSGDRPRVLASNEKLLTSMAALDLLGPSFRFRTEAATDAPTNDGVLHGDLWLVGGGDPTLTTGDLAQLAASVRDAGISRITGDVIGDLGPFDRGWWAPGWLRGISREYVTRPTALRLDDGDASPEPEAAAAFVAALRSAEVTVDGSSRVGRAPRNLDDVATERSPALHTLLIHQNHESDNLYAELTTKALGAANCDAASTKGGASVIEHWAREIGADSTVRDGSGLSDHDRTSSTAMVTMLLAAERRAWFDAFERSLPTGGVGTLSNRLIGVPVHAKTGTLFIRPASTLSGYVTTAAGTTVAFSVLTHGLPETTAIRVEDTVVRALAAADIG